jgi:uroporphyrinogen decarboxylase
LGDIYNLFDQKIALQGNLNTEVLKQENSVIKKEINITLKSFPNDTGHVFNLGSGITPDIHPDKVAFLIDQVNEISSK